ncbi:MAG: hypothetical protein NZ651_05830 [Candidatus Bipolaricaulota bacterium]|nr:hypothetical protein [Candidatus Bipolaricaulota bacterium]MDW8127273.1 hypothetical protein [Candidatus Bipolaricaulota bacterium]
MTILLVGLVTLGAFGTELVFLRPVTWLGDLVTTENSVLIGTIGQVVEMTYEGKTLRTLSFPAGQVQALALGQGYLCAGGWDFLRLWSWPKGEHVRDIQGFGIMVRAVALAAGLALVAGSDGQVRAFSLTSGELLWSLRAHEGTIWGIAAGAEIFATAGSDRAALWHLKTRAEAFSFPGRAWDVAFSSDGFLLAGGVGKILKVWDTACGLTFFEAWAHESCTVAVAFSPDGKMVATGSLDQTAALWDLEKEVLVQRIRGFTSLVTAVGFSADAGFLVAGGEDGTLAILRLP